MSALLARLQQPAILPDPGPTVIETVHCDFCPDVLSYELRDGEDEDARFYEAMEDAGWVSRNRDRYCNRCEAAREDCF